MVKRFAMTLAAALTLSVVSAAAATRIELGGEYGSYSDGLAHAESQFASASWDLDPLWSLRVDASRDERFGDRGLGGGAGLTRKLGSRGVTVGAGLSSGTADVIHPDYRFDLGGMVPLPLAGTQAFWSYTRVQSKGENRSDGFGLGATAWLAGHWILAANLRRDIGHPGDTISDSADLGVTWFQWLRFYLGAGYRFGSVSYELLGVDTALIDYDEDAFYVSASWYIAPDLGLDAKLDLIENDVYELSSLRLSLFRLW